jgi:peptide/nickel transport system ATP-binding protein
MIFQDPLSSLNPRHRVLHAVARPIEVFFGLGAKQAAQRAAALLDELGLGAAYFDRFPRQLSWRSAAARGHCPSVCRRARPDRLRRGDLGMLDATIQGQVLDALLAMQHRRGVAMLVITHDLAVVWRLAQRVLVLQQGRLHEQGETLAGVRRAAVALHEKVRLLASTAAAGLTRPGAAAAPWTALPLPGRPDTRPERSDVS